MLGGYGGLPVTIECPPPRRAECHGMQLPRRWNGIQHNGRSAIGDAGRFPCLPGKLSAKERHLPCHWSNSTRFTMPGLIATKSSCGKTLFVAVVVDTRRDTGPVSQIHPSDRTSPSGAGNREQGHHRARREWVNGHLLAISPPLPLMSPR